MITESLDKVLTLTRKNDNSKDFIRAIPAAQCVGDENPDFWIVTTEDSFGDIDIELMSVDELEREFGPMPEGEI